MGSGRGWLAGDWPSTGGVLNITAAAWTAGFQWWRSDDITRTQNVSEYMIVLALCLVDGVSLSADAGQLTSNGVQASTTMQTTVRQLKHGLGDLKAEWLLVKRDVQQVRHDAGSLRAGQTAIRDDTARLKVAIDLVKTESQRMNAQLDQLASLVNKLQSNVRPPLYAQITTRQFGLSCSLCVCVCGRL